MVGNSKGSTLSLARPLENRVEMGVVGIGLLVRVEIGLRGHEAEGRVVEAFKRRCARSDRFSACLRYCRMFWPLMKPPCWGYS